MQNNFKQCKNRKKCGGCQLQNLSYDEQLKYKQNKVSHLLKDFGKTEPIIGMDNPLHYRNKVQAAFGYDYRHKKLISGVYQSNTHRICPVDDCMIEDKKADEIIVSIRKLMQSFKFKAYDEDSHRGFIRHILVRRGFTTNQIMVVIVSGSRMFPSKGDFVNALLKIHPEITTIVHNVNPYDTNLVLGDRNTVLYGKGYIEDVLCGFTFRISPSSFYQINPVQTEVLYNKAIEFADLKGNELVFDSYCGTGTIGIIASKKAKQVIGVELNGDAVKDAISNARRNKVDNIYFQKGDAGRFLVDCAREKQKIDVLLMDPPRAGSDMKFLSSVLKISPDKIVYVSCNPETLARDLKMLCEKKYKVSKIQPVDMFPYTSHVESVVLLTKVHN